MYFITRVLTQERLGTHCLAQVGDYLAASVMDWTIDYVRSREAGKDVIVISGQLGLFLD